MIQNKALWEKHFPEFVAAQDKSVQSLMDSAMLVEIPAGEKVFYPGKICEYYVLLLEGKIKIQLLSENGREIILYYVVPGDSCVLTTSCLLGENHYPAEAFTEADTKAFLIPAPAFSRCIETSTFFREFVFQNFSSRLSKVIGRMESVLFSPVENRLGALLLQSGANRIAKTHHELAAELGSAREVVSRHLKRFEKNGWIKLGRGYIEIIDLDALHKLSESES